MDVNKYLERININTIRQVSYSFLAQLQFNHLIAVPFENLDIRQGLKIDLDERRFYEKIVPVNSPEMIYQLLAEIFEISIDAHLKPS